MFSRLAESVLRRRLRNSPTIAESVQEAASNQLGKQSKIETAVDGILAHDLQQLAEADRDRVAAYMAAKVPGLANGRKSNGSKMGGDFIVCDDYRKGTGTLPAVLMGVVATAALGLGGMAMWTALQDRPQDVTPAVTPADTDTQYLLELVPGDSP